jgi:hypothetical protein
MTELSVADRLRELAEWFDDRPALNEVFAHVYIQPAVTAERFLVAAEDLGQADLKRPYGDEYELRRVVDGSVVRISVPETYLTGEKPAPMRAASDELAAAMARGVLAETTCEKCSEPVADPDSRGMAAKLCDAHYDEAGRDEAAERQRDESHLDAPAGVGRA